MAHPGFDVLPQFEFRRVVEYILLWSGYGMVLLFIAIKFGYDRAISLDTNHLPGGLAARAVGNQVITSKGLLHYRSILSTV